MKLRNFILPLLLVAGLVIAFRLSQPGITGAWKLIEPSGATVMLTLTDAYLMHTTYEPNRFIASRGGSWQQTTDQLRLMVEFDTQDSSRVGQAETYRVTLQGGKLVLNGTGGSQTFSRVDEPSAQTPLAGLWRITGRANDAGQLTPMQRGARKTLKLLTGSRFQWAAINPQTGQFSGTGGGTYVLKDGKYTETIDFFSRDNSRVGRSLTFDAQVTGAEWHHTGQSSTGGKVDEVWSREK